MSHTQKALVLLFPILYFSFFLQAQNNTPPTISWQKALGGSGYDIANCVKPTADGGLIIAGASASNDGDITGNHGQNDYFLIKLNAAGTLEWSHSYGGSGVDEASGVVQTSDGGYALAGKSTSHNGDVTGNHGASDYWLVKTNAQGTTQWQRSYGGSGTESAYFMEPTGDNGFIIAGSSSSNNGDVSGNHGGTGDAWIVKVDQNGNIQWQKSVGGSQLDVANDIKRTSDGGYIVTGYSLSNDGDITTNKGQEDFLVFKLDAGGNLQWLKTTGGTRADIGDAVIQTLDGGYAICGLTHSRDLDVVGSHGAHDFWVVKTNAQGSTQWTRCLGGSDADDGIEIKQQADGVIIVAGYTGSTDGDVTGLHGGHDIWVAALDTSGNLLWQKTIGGSNFEYPRSLQILSNGQFVIAGRSNSTDGDATENHGNYDCWVLKLAPACLNTFYADADGDGYGNANVTISTCSQPSGYVTVSTDCNDANSSINPGANEVCNGADDNCNGSVDDGLTFITYYIDADGDTYGSSFDNGTSLCSNPGSGYSTTNDDCDDGNSAVNPVATEVCSNLIDDNCNGQIDENCNSFTYYADIDNDSYGDPNNTIASSNSAPPGGYVNDNTDCDDGNSGIHPGANEVCNSLDDNCNSTIDEGVQSTFYADVDGDGFGNAGNTTLACSALSGYVIDNTDCDDGNNSTYPNATESCNGIDDNCNGQIDETCDVDQDGYTIGQGDCNDSNPSINPGATEACNGVDDNCNGTTDEGCDLDGDGYSTAQGDCDDTNPAINPGATETCNAIDDNCNGQVDEGVITAFYADADGDSYGNSLVSTQTCSAPSGYVADQTDCDDNSSSIHPNASEVCNTIDDNCNGQVDEGVISTFYIDADGDTYGNNSATTQACNILVGYVPDHTDCDDANSTIHPNATEVCNTVDDNCNGQVDEGVKTIFYADTDGDGYGNNLVTTQACSAPSGYVPDHTDCDDAHATTHPNAAETCNGIDDNCNTQIDEGAVTATITPAGTATICSGSNVTLYANTGSGLTYQWKKNGANISGSTLSTYTAKVAASFTVVVSSGSCSATSSPTVTSISALPSATITPSGTASVCPGVSFTMNANTGSGLSYQWQKSSANISGATNNSYITTITGSYKVIVTNSGGCSKTSAATTLNNYAAASVKITNTGSLNICSTGSVILNAKIVSGYSYQWFKDNVAINGATGSSYTATQSGTYYYQATTPNGCTANSANKVVTSCKIGDESTGITVLSVYPNPTSGNFTVELHFEYALLGTARIEIINLMGDVMLAEDADISEGALLHTITVKREFPDALYFVRVSIGDQFFFQRIVLQR